MLKMRKILMIVLVLVMNISNNYQNNKSINYYNIDPDTYIDTENKNIKIDIPQIETDDFLDVNKLIKETIIDYIQGYYSNDLTDIAINLSYDITYNQKDLISIQFKGDGYKKSAAHPNHLFKTLNIDMKRKQLIKLNDIYKVDERFIEKYIEEFKRQVPQDRNSIIDSYSMEQLLNYFNDADSGNSVIMSYYHNDNVGISILVPYAIGEHIEIELNKKLMSDYK